MRASQMEVAYHQLNEMQQLIREYRHFIFPLEYMRFLGFIKSTTIICRYLRYIEP